MLVSINVFLEERIFVYIPKERVRDVVLSMLFKDR